MSQLPNRPEVAAFRRLWLCWVAAVSVAVVLGLAGWYAASLWQGSRSLAAGGAAGAADDPPLPPAPEFDKIDRQLTWLNTAGPIHLKDLRGKFVLLDFWTLCCINCMHTLPDVAKLEKKYANQLVVIGVHSPKFDNEHNSESIRKAILRYEIAHPVVNDRRLRIWAAYGVQSWPTLALIDPEGGYLGQVSGEGHCEALDRYLGNLIKVYRARKTLNEKPLHFELARYQERGDSPLFFPGKVLADAAGNRLFIADSTHHRIVITDLIGKKIAVAGTGEPDKADGPFTKASFNDPQGMALGGNTLYVADCRNHLIRALDLRARTVRTIAGTGRQDRRSQSDGGPALKVGLNSPWDLCLMGNMLYIAMAGHHQIWVLDLSRNMIAPFAGTGREFIRDGPLDRACFAQPSGLTTDGTTLYVADSEGSAVRAVSLKKLEVRTIIGVAGAVDCLFDFGDRDGVGSRARLQHALGVAWHAGKLYVADTYNSKIKIVDPVRRSSVTFLGAPSGWLAGPMFSEPGGLSFAGAKLYVADTNAHRIRVIDLKTKAVRTLALHGVEPPRSITEPERPVFPNPVRTTLKPVTVPNDGDLTLQVQLVLAKGFKLNRLAKMAYVVETTPANKTAWSETKAVPQEKTAVKIIVPLAKLAGASGLQLSLVYYECSEGSEGVCRIKSHIWDVPLQFDPAATRRLIELRASSATIEDNK